MAKCRDWLNRHWDQSMDDQSHQCKILGVIAHPCHGPNFHYDDVIMTMLASQITSLTVVYSIVYSGVNQRKHQSSASLAFVWEIHRGPMNFPHKWPVTRKMFPFDDVIMFNGSLAILPPMSFIGHGWIIASHWKQFKLRIHGLITVKYYCFFIIRVPLS